MSVDLFEKIEGLSTGATVKIYFAGATPPEPGGVSIDAPFTTTVENVTEQRLLEGSGAGSDGIETKAEIHLDPPACDDVHEEYVIQIERLASREVKVSPIEAREYFEGSPGDGRYAARHVGFTDIEVTD